MRKNSTLVTLFPALIVLLAACQGGGGPAATPGPAETREVRALREARVPLDKAVEAAGKNDWATAKAAFFDYTEAWNGMEQYVRVRSLELYHAIEDPFGDITSRLEGATPPAAEVNQLLKAQQDNYAKAQQLAQAGPAPQTVVDQVFDLRNLRLQLRATQRALRANNVQAAQDSYRKFEAGWDSVEDYIRDKSRDLYRDIETSMGDVNAALLRASSPEAAQVTPLLDTLLMRYSQGLSLVAAGLPAA